jgi:hypothetical protein
MMKTLTLTLMAAALLTAEDQPANNSPTRKPASASKKATPSHSEPVSIPPQATQIGPNTYRYTDPQGKVWLYARTPFGISKWEEPPAAQSQANPAAEDPSLIKVTDLGDSVRFERQTPFGITPSVRKKSELTEEEKALLDREQSKNRPQAAETAAGKPSEKSADKATQKSAEKPAEKQ